MKQWIALFAKHRIAANGAMFVVLAAGWWGLTQLNSQFFPDFEFERINVSSTWNGVSAEDMYAAVAIPLQQALLDLPEIGAISTNASEGRVNLSISITDRAGGLSNATELIETTVSNVTLPEEASEPAVTTPQRLESVADLLIYGDIPIDELTALVANARNELLASGLAQVSIQGAPLQTLEVTVSVEQLLAHQLTLTQIATAISSEYSVQPAGTADGGQLTLQLRSLTPNISTATLSDIVITTTENGGVIRLNDIAHIERVVNDNSSLLFYQKQPAIRLSILRTPGEDTLEAAEQLKQWRISAEPWLPNGVSLHTYNETWQIVSAQLQLLVKNGAVGMALVMIALFLFLNTRLAFWVAMGIPISFFATFFIMSQLGISLNTISLFGFMIALGVIVDDAIVVGEQTRAYQQQGMNPQESAIKAALKMWPPVLASSLTTIAAFMPLLLIDGPIGRLAADIPVVVTIAITASLIECFLILPGHLSHTKHKTDRPLRQKLDTGFNHLRDQWFRPMVRWALTNRTIIVAFVFANFLVAIGLVTSRTVPFQFQPSVESPSMSASVTFAEGTDPKKVNDFVDAMLDGLQTVAAESEFEFIKTAVVNRNQGGQANQARIDVELISDQNRPISNQELVNQWRQQVSLVSEIESIAFGRGRRFGEEAGDISIRLSGTDINDLKNAATALKTMLVGVNGLSDATDSLPYGDEQLQFSLTPVALDLGISEAAIAAHLRSILQGLNAIQQVSGLQTFDVVVLIPEEQRTRLIDIFALPYFHNGQVIPFEDLVDLHYERGLDGLRALDGRIAVTVNATLDVSIMTDDDMYTYLNDVTLPEFKAMYGTIDVQLDGQAQEQADFFSDIFWVLMAVVVLIFGILAWVFESWTWPIAILITVPFGLVGAIYGHWLMDLPLSSLSVLGLFGLSGIVINDSIVLTSVYRDLREEGIALFEALEEAVASRLRPVMLTSVTTIAGLTPLLFETSLDAEFLKPIAAGLVFGMLFAMLLVLMFMPALLLTIEQARTYNSRSVSHASL